jgi:hypothetical protein
MHGSERKAVVGFSHFLLSQDKTLQDLTVKDNRKLRLSWKSSLLVLDKYGSTEQIAKALAVSANEKAGDRLIETAKGLVERNKGAQGLLELMRKRLER